ncbi:MAG: hypothetical protein JRJ80_16075, partial [Deltaproteobacteria bacterium]|nr:hypothetical protein [Deltaproteobacteria bacterium]
MKLSLALSGRFCSDGPESTPFGPFLLATPCSWDETVGMLPVPVTKTSACFVPDPTRVITKPFTPGSERSVDGRSRVERILSRILALSESEVTTTLSTTQARFAARHVDLRSVFEANFAAVAAGHVARADELSAERRLLIGAYFTHEYSFESTALSNPSIVPAPDQEGLAPGEQRFVLSLRAIG